MKKITLKQDSLTYELGVDLENWAKSKEDRILEIGDVRVIGKILMCVYQVKYGFLKSEYTWTPVDVNFNNFENQRNWLNNV